MLFGYQLLGVIITPNNAGGLADPVWWILRRIDTPPEATTQTIAVGQHGSTTTTSSSFFLMEGRLSSSTLSPIAEALAAVISWGTWSRPQPAMEPTWSASCTLRYNLGELVGVGTDLGEWFDQASRR